MKPWVRIIFDDLFVLVKQIEITEPRCDDRIFSSDTCEIKYCWWDPHHC